MSRAYRIRVSESTRRVIRAEDHVGSQLELLTVLPADQMASLLADQLAAQGFQREGDRAIRSDGDLTTEVDLESGEFVVRVQRDEEMELKSEKSGYAYDDAGPSKAQVKESLREQARQGFDKAAQDKAAVLQRELTDRLEQELADITCELDQAVNQVTAAALKIKAAQLGQIKQVTDDPETGSLTIVVEV